MRPPLIRGALAESRLRPGPKTVIIASPRDAAGNPILPLGSGYSISDAALDDFEELLEILKTDCDAEKLQRFYRSSASRRGDDLLRSDWRVMHLHLVNPGSDDIVYLVQRDDDVVIILEISDHGHLEEVPRGKSLRLDRAKNYAATVPYVPPPAHEEDEEE